MHNDIRLRAPIVVTADDVERALFEQSMDELTVARVVDQLYGAAAERAAEELNHALDVNIFDVLSQGWASLPAVRLAEQRSLLMLEPPPLVNLDQHTIASTSQVVLDTSVEQSALPPLDLTLEIVADIESAALVVREGHIDLVALGEASIIARIRYKTVLIREHMTGLSGVRRDPFKRHPSEAKKPVIVDIPI